MRKYNLKNYYESFYASKTYTLEHREFSRKYYDTFLNLLEVRRSKTILDIGCGDGYLLCRVANRGLKCFGVDISENATKLAQLRLSNTDSKILCSDGEFLPFKSQLFDYVTALGSLEHFPDMGIALKEMYRVGKPKCRYCILVPNTYYLLHILGYKTADQPLNQLRSLTQWRILFNKHGLKPIKIIVDNHHLLCPISSSRLKHSLKHIIRPIIPIIPKHLSYQLAFLCIKEL